MGWTKQTYLRVFTGYGQNKKNELKQEKVFLESEEVNLEFSDDYTVNYKDLATKCIQNPGHGHSTQVPDHW